MPKPIVFDCFRKSIIGLPLRAEQQRMLQYFAVPETKRQLVVSTCLRFVSLAAVNLFELTELHPDDLGNALRYQLYLVKHRVAKLLDQKKGKPG